ncbi:malate dehydrogenase [Candidatus Pantoea edessiphila]|uniref:Malate dehydrogenase n=1 Tax=Candidatus Pantoea edessiphila TaxID=2044610 RepID=A0A2P5T1L3_9GAMM|nr:malate dehydrogenase [Candidatus Pantoea edessiphila]PPI88491.1 malate dehydrogenase [Candidatus Pantoea edessiphila]
MRISILGAAGNIGQALSLLLKIYLPVGSELHLYDVTPAMLGIALDLSHVSNNVIVKGFIGKDITQALVNTDIVIISAGIARKPGMERDDLFNINADIILKLIKQIVITSPNALIGIITNPINSTVVIAAEILKKYQVYDKRKLFGITTLDSIRANKFVHDMKGKNVNNINVPVIGGHSNQTILPLLSKLRNINFNNQEVIDITRRIQNAGDEVIKYKSGSGSATLSMSYAASRFCLSLVNGLLGNSNILEYAYIEGDSKYAKFFSQPFVLGKNGIIEYKEIGKISLFEESILNNMISHLNQDILRGEMFVKKLSSI